MNIGEEFKKWRGFANMTQAEVADLLEMSKAQWSQYETGKRVPKVSTLRKMLEIANKNRQFIDDLPFADPVPEEIKALGKKQGQFITGLEEIFRRAQLPWNAEESDTFVIMEPLNEIGRGKVADYAADIAKIPEYRSDTQPE